jgi:hypothetical protein
MKETAPPTRLDVLDLTTRVKESDEDFDKMYLLQTMIAAYTNPQAHYDLNQNGMSEPERRAEIATLSAMLEEMMH